MQKKRLIAVITCIFLIAAMFSACGGQQQPAAPQQQAQSSAEAPAAPAAPAEEKIELLLWTGTWHDEDGSQEMLAKKFNEQYPNVTIKSEYYPWDGMNDKYLIALQADNGPDLIDIAAAWTIPFAMMGKLVALDSYIADANIDLSDYFDGPMETCTTNGQIFALPYRTECVTLFYNTRLFKEAGLDPSKPPQTYDELIEYGKKLTKDGVAGFGLTGREAGNVTVQIYSAMMAAGAKILTDDLTKTAFNSPEGLLGFKTWSDMHTVHKIAPASVLENDNTANRNLFAQEKVAMYISGNYDVAPILEANPNIEMDFAIVPKIKINSTQIGGWSMAVTNTCKYPAEGFNWVKFICSTENAPLYSLTFPSLRSATSNEKYADPMNKAFLDALEYAYPLPPSPKMTEITNILYSQAQAVLAGTKTAEEALKDAADEGDAALAS